MTPKEYLKEIIWRIENGADLPNEMARELYESWRHAIDKVKKLRSILREENHIKILKPKRKNHGEG
jgi:hypothetical protein